jgi:hypothetical protein
MAYHFFKKSTSRRDLGVKIKKQSNNCINFEDWEVDNGLDLEQTDAS